MNIDKSKEFWEKCDTTFAHITADRWLKSKEKLVDSFKHRIQPFNAGGKVVVDYGIGAAHLGIYLLDNVDIKKYIGIDIAKRSLDAAKVNLSKYDQSKIDLKLAPVDFSTLNADMICSFAVIQHFPSIDYLDQFLNNVNFSNINEAVLQIRHSESNKFSGSCDTQDDMMMGCTTNKKYLLSILTNYECAHESAVHEGSNYHYLYFKKIIK